MALFGFGKKKEEKKLCCCGENTKNQSVTPDISAGTIKSIKVLGAGCKSCHEQYEYAKKAVAETGLSVGVEYITDMQKIMEYGIMKMPALIVNEKVIAMGKVLKPAEIVKLLKKVSG